jgi:hypothetical protein
MTAVELSTALFGEDAHCVTARAEVSSLRRVLGGLVSTNPFRLADGVRLTVVRPEAADLVPAAALIALPASADVVDHDAVADTEPDGSWPPITF